MDQSVSTRVASYSKSSAIVASSRRVSKLTSLPWSIARCHSS